MRTDWGFRFAHFICRIIGHKWTPWEPLPDERCERCLLWKAGEPPHPPVTTSVTNPTVGSGC